MIDFSNSTKLNPVENWLNQRQPESKINFGLDRIKKVADIAFKKYHSNPKAKIISIAGTNGKGSAGFFLANLFKAQGIKAGWYSSPHFFHYNERIQIDLSPLSDSVLLKHLKMIEKYTKQAGVDLSYFEYSTLCALDIFFAQKLEVIILEVGLGGRLDAVNLMDADIALITSIALDHCDYLGNTLADIAKEKSGIFRKNQIIVIGENANEPSLIAKAHQLSNQVLLVAKNLTYKIKAKQFSVSIENNNANLNCTISVNDWMLSPAMLSNLSLATYAFLSSGFFSNNADQYFDFSELKLIGRLEKFQINHHTYYVDIAHNPEAVGNVLNYLQEKRQKNIIAIIAFLQDKDYQSILNILDPWVEFYYLPKIDHERVLSIADLTKTMKSLGITNFLNCSNLNTIIDKINQNQQKKQILIIGCFALAIKSMQILTGLVNDKK